MLSLSHVMKQNKLLEFRLNLGEKTGLGISNWVYQKGLFHKRN